MKTERLAVGLGELRERLGSTERQNPVDRWEGGREEQPPRGDPGFTAQEISNDVYHGGGRFIWSKWVKTMIFSREKNTFSEYYDSGSTKFGRGWDPTF